MGNCAARLQLIYNLPMARTHKYAARLAVAFLACTPCWAFQASGVDTAISILPRFRPAVSTGQSLLPKADIRIDSALVLVPAQVTNILGVPITDLHKGD